MDTMKAVVYDRPGKFAVRQIPVSEPGAGEVLLRVLVAGVCGTDLHLHHGEFGPTYPLIPGHEIVGETGDKIGKVADVIYATETAEPAYVRVDFGVLKGHHVLVPLDEAYRTDHGDLVVPFDKDTVKHAPKVPTPVALTKPLEHEVEEYYSEHHS